jgi:transcriptional regulator with XRE-family HTH domain
METADNRKKRKKEVHIQLGRKLRGLREDSGMTQQQLAKSAGMVQPMINRFETGERGMNVKHATKLAAVFRIPPTDLLPLDIIDMIWQAAGDTHLADAHTRIHEQMADLQRRIQELEQAKKSQP